VTYGVVVSPRYPYSVRDELTWHQAMKGFAEREARYLSQEDAELKRWKEKGESGLPLAHSIEKELIPFYAEFEKKMSALTFTPGRQTDRRRQLLIEFVKIRQESHGHLLRAVREKSPDELDLYNQSERNAGRLLRSLRELER
jgi:hypothetical protein